MLPQLEGKSTSARWIDRQAISGVMDGLALRHLFDPDGFDNQALVRYLRLCVAETISRK